jgi:hypothetical protein
MDLNPLCQNESWATVRAEPTLDRNGHDVAVVVAKVAYEVDPRGRVTLSFRPVRWSDVGDGHGGIKFAGELVDEKPGTDVALVGTAHPPRGKKVDRMLAWVTAGNLRKVVNVFGARRFTAEWRGVVAGPPATVEPTPLRYDLCFGGRDEEGEVWHEEAHNPAGRGFATDPTRLAGREAHVLEPVVDPKAGTTPHPSHGCFAPIPANWAPRLRYAGTHDEAWAKTRAPVRPKDFDVSHNLWAPPELHALDPLAPDVDFEIGGVIEEGLWRFKLPKYAVSFASITQGQRLEHPTHLDSVVIDADERTVELSWRAAIRLPRKWEFLEKICVRGEGTMPDSVLDDSHRREASARTPSRDRQARPGGA